MESLGKALPFSGVASLRISFDTALGDAAPAVDHMDRSRSEQIVELILIQPEGVSRSVAMLISTSSGFRY